MRKNIISAILFAMATTFAMAEEPAAESSHWTRSGDGSLQFTQGYVSKNWYKGGESNFALVATANYNFNYKYEKFTWDNLVEAKLGFISTPSDQFHKYMANQDLLKWTSKVGYEAGNNWFYTLQAIGQTQFSSGYKANDETLYSKFMNPAYLTISLGMDWKKEEENVKWTVFISPLAYNLKYVGDPLRGVVDSDGGYTKGLIDGTQFGLKAGDFNIYDLGASAKALMELKVSKYLTWTSQASYFSPLYNCGKYKNNGYTNFEWENTFDMPLNKYFSTKLYTHLRFDDSVGPENKGTGWGYFQLTELLSFGLSCKF